MRTPSSTSSSEWWHLCGSRFWAKMVFFVFFVFKSFWSFRGLWPAIRDQDRWPEMIYCLAGNTWAIHQLPGDKKNDFLLTYYCSRSCSANIGLTWWSTLRARPLTLHPHMHRHLYIRNADADAGKCPTQPGNPQMWMKKFPGGAQLPAFSRFMQGACYQLKTNNFRKVLEIIGWGLIG
jgi:hypothetical protein